jgi:hypothetical protein
MKSANRRYLEFISAVEDDKVGKEKLVKITQKVKADDRYYRVLNFFDKQDESIQQIITCDEFNNSGF